DPKVQLLPSRGPTSLPLGDCVVISMRAFKLAFAWSFAVAALAALHTRLHMGLSHFLGLAHEIYASVSFAIPLSLAVLCASAFWPRFKRLPVHGICGLFP